MVSVASYESDNQNYYCNYQEKMNQTSESIGCEDADEPKYDKDEEYRPKHIVQV